VARGKIPNYALRVAKPSGLPGAIGISRKTFEQLEDWMRDVASTRERADEGMDMLIQTMALATKAGAQRRSMGPVAARKRSVPSLAYRIPVQRITGGYFAGWTHQRVGRMHWRVYNDSREAYFIETGLYMRVRRPILKMSVLGMLQMIQTTRTAERMADWVLLPLRDNSGRFQSFSKRSAAIRKQMTLASGGEGRGFGNPNIAGPQARLP